MSISGTLFNAYSGLVAAARTAEAVSNNVANAQTDGYGRREVQLHSAATAGRGTGVRVSGVIRDVDTIAIADRRLASAQLHENAANLSALQRLESALGLPGKGNALTEHVLRFEESLISAQSHPDSNVHLQNILQTASDLTTKINHQSDAVQTIRQDADRQITREVDSLNQTLGQIADLNRNIRVQLGGGRDVNGLMDQRQVLVDRVAEQVSLKVFQRDHGQIALVTTGGTTLLDGLPAEVSFVPAGTITADMTQASGALSGLLVNGKTIVPGSGNGPMNGGRIAGLFQQRDAIGQEANSQIDAFARSLIERFETSGLDATRSIGDAGLFTDAGQPFSALDEAGLAGRLEVNGTVDPDQGGALWRLRDGLGATAEGTPGEAGLITDFLGVLQEGLLPGSGQFSSGRLSLSELAGDLVAQNAGKRLFAEDSNVSAAARHSELKQIELSGGVDTDQEMQKLLLIEQAYAANARVISTVDQMLQTILEL